MKKLVERLEFFILVVALLCTSVVQTRAESKFLDDATAVQEIATDSASDASWFKQTRQRKACNPRRRGLVGAAIGFIVGMVAVQKAAAANDGTVGAKETLYAGVYGAAIGGVVGLAMCR